MMNAASDAEAEVDTTPITEEIELGDLVDPPATTPWTEDPYGRTEHHHGYDD